MPVYSLLLRMLLCVVLVANGVGAVQAGVRMQTAHVVHGATTRAAVSSTVGRADACHSASAMTADAERGMPPMDHAGMGHDGVHPVSDSSDGPLPADGGTDEPMDCCDGSRCQCACTQHASATFIEPVAGAPLASHVVVAVRGSSQHASPRLPHLIRPPIR